MYSRLLKSDKELKHFQSQYLSHSQNPIELAYLKKSHVRAFYLKGEMKAGYALYTGSDKRYLEMIPEKGITRQIQQEIQNNSLEVTCMWVSREYSSVANRVYLYTSYAIDCFKKNKKYAIAGSFSEKIKKLHSVPYSQMIYEGESLFHDHPKTLWVYRETRYSHIFKVLIFIVYLAITISLKSLITNILGSLKETIGQK